MTDCPCCCDHYHGLRKAVKCQFCDYESCQHCYHTYTTSGNSLMHCMECKKEWSDDFIFKKLYKKVRQWWLQTTPRTIIDGIPKNTPSPNPTIYGCLPKTQKVFRQRGRKGG